MTYERRVDRNNPSCLIFLVDQSASMKEQIVGAPVSKAAALAEQLNGLLYELIQRSTKSLNEPPRPYFAIAVIGYRTEADGRPVVGSVLQIPNATGPLAWTTDLANNPLRLDERQRTPGDPSQKFVVPVWVDALSSGGTPVCSAIDQAGRIARSWVDRYPDSFPPIVINLSDGESTDGDPSEWATRLCGMATNDGNVLFFNLDLSSSNAQPALFPSAPQGDWNKFSRLMFEMSSPLPDVMLTAARAQGFAAPAGARGFGLNADFRSVVTFLNVGTSIGHMLR